MAISEQQLKIQLKAAGIKTTKAQLKSLHGQVNQTSKGVTKSNRENSVMKMLDSFYWKELETSSQVH